MPAGRRKNEDTDADVVAEDSFRKCQVTGKRLPKSDMVRFVLAPDGTVTPDIEARLPGRGLWLSSDKDVIKKAEQGPCFRRCWKKSVSVPADLERMVESLLLKRCLNLIGLAVRSGDAVTGFEKVRIWLKGKTPGLLMAAKDGADDGRSRIRALSGNAKVMAVLTARELGQATGREQAVHMVIAPGGLADKIKLDLKRLGRIREVAEKPED